MKEENCKFTQINENHCKECKRKVLHEFGTDLKTKEKVKKCIKCDTITILKGV